MVIPSRSSAFVTTPACISSVRPMISLPYAVEVVRGEPRGVCQHVELLPGMQVIDNHLGFS